MKILCIGDSLGLPRSGCNYEETWLHLLRNRYPQHIVIDHCEGGRLIDNALSAYNGYYKFYGADIIILQLGICDCAPRYVNEKKAINRMIKKAFVSLGLTELYWRIVKSHVRRPNCVDTQPEVFKNMYGKLIDNILTEGGYIIIVKIGHGAQSVTNSSPYFNTNVDRYNSIIDKLVEAKEKVFSVDPLNLVTEEIFVDGYHCNAKGMTKVYELLCPLIEKIEAIYEKSIKLT